MAPAGSDASTSMCMATTSLDGNLHHVWQEEDATLAAEEESEDEASESDAEACVEGADKD